MLFRKKHGKNKFLYFIKDFITKDIYFLFPHKTIEEAESICINFLKDGTIYLSGRDK